MSLDLTPQFVRDYEELKKKVVEPHSPPPPPPELIERLEAEISRLREELKNQPTVSPDLIESLQTEVTRLQARVEKLETEVEQLEKVNKRLFKQNADANALKEAEIKKIRAENSEKLETLKDVHAREIEWKEESLNELRGKLALKEKELENRKASIDEEIAKRTKSLESKAKRELAKLKDEMTLASKATLETTQARIIEEVDSKLLKLTYMPLGMRLAGLILDVLLLVGASATIRFATNWSQEIPDRWFILAVFGIFCLRTFFSTGNLLLGISARQIGSDLRPTGPIGLTAQLFCGLLHYGPLLATAYFAVADDKSATRSGLMNLLGWAYHPFTNDPSIVSIFNDLIKPQSGAPGVVLAATLVWWGFLLLSILFSSLIHLGSPCFRNTTLVEWLFRVGFQRFSPPLIEIPQVES